VVPVPLQDGAGEVFLRQLIGAILESLVSLQFQLFGGLLSLLLVRVLGVDHRPIASKNLEKKICTQNKLQELLSRSKFAHNIRKKSLHCRIIMEVYLLKIVCGIIIIKICVDLLYKVLQPATNPFRLSLSAASFSSF
jgi:hypothetical protein